MTKMYGLRQQIVTALPLANMRIAGQALWLTGAVLVAILLKAVLLLGGVVPFNSDEAIVALMARHLLQGARPVFFYGQAYMGSLDAILVAAGFLIFGQQVWVIRLVQSLLYAGTLLTTGWLGRKAFGSWQTGILAAWLLAIPAVNVTLYTTVSLGGYGEMLLLGNLILLISIYAAERLSQGEWRRFGWLCLGWGFLVGLGFWAFGLTLVYSVPAGIFLAYQLLKLARENPKRMIGSLEVWKDGKLEGWKVAVAGPGLALAGFVMGASPLLVYAFQNGFGQAILELQGSAIAGVEGLAWPQQVLQHLLNLILLGSTAVFGLRPPWEVRWLVLPLLPFVLFFWMAVLAHLARRVKSQKAERPKLLLIAGVGITLVLGFAFTPFGADPSGRYFLPLAVPLALFGGDMILKLSRRRGRWAFALAAFILVYNSIGTLQTALRVPPGITTQFDAVAQIDHGYDQELMSFLRTEGESRGYSNYWVAYPLAFHSGEELIFVPRLPYHQDFRYTPRDDRYAPYGELVAQAGRVAYITTNHPQLDEYLRTSFAESGISWRERRIGDYQVFYALSRAVRPEEIGLGIGTTDEH